MEFSTIIIIVVSVLRIAYLINIYNHLVRIKHNFFKATSSIDMLLKQSHDEIPKLVMSKTIASLLSIPNTAVRDKLVE